MEAFIKNRFTRLYNYVTEQLIIQRYNGEESHFQLLTQDVIILIFCHVPTDLMASLKDWKSIELVCRRWAKLMKEMQETIIKIIVDNLMKEAKDKWENHFGNIDPVPEMPNNIVQILRSPCPFWPDKRVYETHLLTLVPKTVNGTPLTLKYMGQLIQNPKKGSKTQFDKDTDFYNHEKTAVDKPHWILMTKDVIPNSRNKSFQDQLKLVKEYNKMSYELVHLIDAVVAILLEHVSKGTRLYPVETLTLCQEREQDKGDYGQIMHVGGFSRHGLRVSHYFGNALEYFGIGVSRKFYA